ncbi:unnamed protein product, partial [marine sediment metagenome]
SIADRLGLIHPTLARYWSVWRYMASLTEILTITLEGRTMSNLVNGFKRQCVALFLAASVAVVLAGPAFSASCGNADGDMGESVNIEDIMYMVDYLYGQGTAPAAPNSGDVDTCALTTLRDL